MRLAPVLTRIIGFLGPLGILRHVFCHRSSFNGDRSVVVTGLIVIVVPDDNWPDRNRSGERVLGGFRELLEADRDGTLQDLLTLVA